MGEVIELFPGRDIEFIRSVRAVERFMKDFLADGPKIAQSVRRRAEHISTITAHFEQARMNIGILHVQDTVRHRWYWALPGHEDRVPNAWARILVRKAKSKQA
jgi:hypothetical protein